MGHRGCTESMSKCQCPLAGYCETHKREMSKRQHEQCKNVPGMFEAFAALPPMPSIAQRMVSVTKAASRVVKSAATGNKPFVSFEVLEKRKSACSTCDREQAGWCGKCGCALGAKQRLATETCPLGRWPD